MTYNLFNLNYSFALNSTISLHFLYIPLVATLLIANQIWSQMSSLWNSWKIVHLSWKANEKYAFEKSSSRIAAQVATCSLAVGRSRETVATVLSEQSSNFVQMLLAPMFASQSKRWRKNICKYWTIIALYKKISQPLQRAIRYSSICNTVFLLATRNKCKDYTNVQDSLLYRIAPRTYTIILDICRYSVKIFGYSVL